MTHFALFQIGCIATAAILHYFFTAAFSWAFCESLVLVFYPLCAKYCGSFILIFLIGWGELCTCMSHPCFMHCCLPSPSLNNDFLFPSPSNFLSMDAHQINLSHYNKFIIVFLIIQGNIQFSGYALSLPAVGPILPPSN